MAIKLFIVDDHKIMIDGIISLLGNDPAYEVIGTAMNGEQALKALELAQPDILLSDVQMPIMNGIELTKAVKQKYPSVKVLILTMFNDSGIVENIVQEGADGYILKNTGREELVDALTTIASGKTFFAKDVVETMMENLRNPHKPTSSTYINSADLTEREKEIVRLITQEFSSEQIADKLFISRRTVETHRKNIIRKTGASNVVGLVKYAMEHGLG